jgi:hypothetical protein
MVLNVFVQNYIFAVSALLWRRWDIKWTIIQLWMFDLFYALMLLLNKHSIPGDKRTILFTLLDITLFFGIKVT